MSGQLHAPTALSTGKEPPIPLRQVAVWTPEPVWTRRRIENSLPYRPLGRLVRSLALYRLSYPGSIHTFVHFILQTQAATSFTSRCQESTHTETKETRTPLTLSDILAYIPIQLTTLPSSLTCALTLCPPPSHIELHGNLQL
jgi:hypothetical protein